MGQTDGSGDRDCGRVGLRRPRARRPGVGISHVAASRSHIGQHRRVRDVPPSSHVGQ